jgi:HD-GYP domain-containing protein (c-di-GMP phosphodiesterase class II)
MAMNSVVNVLQNMVTARDKNTGGHCDRVADLVRLILNEMHRSGSLPPDLNIEFAVSAAHLHDLGKIAIPDAILFKPGKLTAEEREIYQSHAAAGERIISEIASQTDDCELFDYAREIAAYHHERWDGKGYPSGLKGEEIPLLARITAIADAYDRESADLPKNEGRFDPVIYEVFLGLALP